MMIYAMLAFSFTGRPPLSVRLRTSKQKNLEKPWRPRDSWRADGFRGCWEDQAHAILEDQRLALVTNLGVHHLGDLCDACDFTDLRLRRLLAT